jgi:hypothetical protein
MSEDLIRCPSCRGSKKVAKLGGMIGECNSCNGDGKIKQGDKPKLVEAVPEVPVMDLIAGVSRVVKEAPVEGNVPRAEIQKAVESIKVDPKRAIYKRKKA